MRDRLFRHCSRRQTCARIGGNAIFEEVGKKLVGKVREGHRVLIKDAQYYLQKEAVRVLF
jgi:hypothetical protein